MALLSHPLPTNLSPLPGAPTRGLVCHRLQELKCSRTTSVGDVRTQLPELELEETKVMLRKRQLTIFQPKEVDEVLEMYIQQDMLHRDPYWCRLWPSALALADKILEHPELVSGLRVCDLGAGLGLAGLAAALAGASEVVLYDREVQALFCALLNIHANISNMSTNLPQIMKLVTSITKVGASLSTHTPVPDQLVQSAYLDLARKVQTLPLSKVASDAQPRNCSVVRAELFDWTNKPAKGLDFDVVLACDVLYEKPAINVIADLAPQLLRKRAGSRLLVSDPVERNPKNRELFVQLFGSASDRNHMTLDGREELMSCMDGQSHQVELLSFTRTV